MKKQKALAGHGQVYHAAMGCQAASLYLTAHGLRGGKKACPAKGKKERGLSLFCRAKQSKRAGKVSSSASGVRALSSFKCVGVITGLALPHAIDDSDPDLSQCPHCHTMALALSPFTTIVVKRPGFLSGTRPAQIDRGRCAAVSSRQSVYALWRNCRC
jgi:hypothetical protein